MPENIIYRVHDMTGEIAEQNARMRDTLARSRELLREPAPNTFLGRSTHEPFPKAEG